MITFGPMTAQKARSIVGWQYRPPYDFYNFADEMEPLAELLNGTFQSALDTSGNLIGFYCVGMAAQVPAGQEQGIYVQPNKGIVDLGLGLRPDLTGKGLGRTFVSAILEEVALRHKPQWLRLTVATFNKRAIRLYTALGFQVQSSFCSDPVLFQTMLRKEVRERG